MAPHSWANEEQEKLLQSMLSEYMEINAGSKDYGDFWAKLRQVWFQAYSECDILFPGKSQSALLEEERSQVGDAMKKTMSVRQSITQFTRLTRSL
jgi:vacuolar-type H+-ATPase subunit E/Vma4